MSPDEHAELEALKQDQAYDDWIANVTDPELHRTHSRTCRMCGKSCPAGYMRGHICMQCDNELLLERAIDETRTTEEPLCP